MFASASVAALPTLRQTPSDHFYRTEATLTVHGQEESDKARELLSILQRLGATTVVFEHTIAEMDRVLRSCEKYIDNPLGRGRMIQEMRRLGKTGSDVALLRSRVVSRLGSFRVLREKAPNYDPAFQIDETVLHKALDDDIGYHNDRAIQDDVNSIRSIYALRRGLSPIRLEDAKAVLVTTNSALARTAYEYGKTYESLREVSSVVSDFSLANVAWLKAPLDAPQLPAAEMLSVCYAALEPSSELWSKYVEEIDQLEAAGDITPQDHKRLRYSLRAQEELMHLTLGNDEALTTSTVSGILDKVRSELTAESNAELAEATGRAITFERERDLERERIDTAREKIYALSTRIGRALSRSLVGGAAIVLGTALIVVSAKWNPRTDAERLLLGLCSLLTILFGLANWVLGLSLFGVGEKIEVWVSSLIQRFLLRQMSLELPPISLEGPASEGEE